MIRSIVLVTLALITPFVGSGQGFDVTDAAQSIEGKHVYCTIIISTELGSWNSNVQIDFGDSPWLLDIRKRALTNPNSENLIDLNNGMTVLNHLTNQKWTLNNSNFTFSNDQLIQYYLLSKFFHNQ